MRVSDSQFSQMMLQSLRLNNAGLGQVLQQMSTSNRLTKLSDDPMAAIKLLNLEREGSAISQYQKNIANTKTTLSNQEVYLDSINESLKNINELVLSGANGTLSDEDRKGIVTELKSLRESMVSSFNAKDQEGNFLFSGTMTSTPAVSNDTGSYVVGGNADKRLVTVANGVTMESNKTAQEILDIGGTNVLNELDALIAEFESPTDQFDVQIEKTLSAVNATTNNVWGAMTDIGGQINNLDLMESAHGETKLFVDKVNSDISALDYGEASVRLNNYLAALQATQASYVKINDLNLFDRI